MTHPPKAIIRERGGMGRDGMGWDGWDGWDVMGWDGHGQLITGHLTIGASIDQKLGQLTETIVKKNFNVYFDQNFVVFSLKFAFS